MKIQENNTIVFSAVTALAGISNVACITEVEGALVLHCCYMAVTAGGPVLSSGAVEPAEAFVFNAGSFP